MYSQQNLIPVSCYFPLRFPHPNPIKIGNPAPAHSQNSRFPLLFLALIPSITTKNSQIPHPAKPIVDPLGSKLSGRRSKYKSNYKEETTFRRQDVRSSPQGSSGNELAEKESKQLQWNTDTSSAGMLAVNAVHRRPTPHQESQKQADSKPKNGRKTVFQVWLITAFSRQVQSCWIYM